MAYMNYPLDQGTFAENGNKLVAAIPSKNLILINNLLSAVVSQTEIPKEQYVPWLKSEMGFDDEKIAELKMFGCFPEPA